jgi:hypothetical protein
MKQVDVGPVFRRPVHLYIGLRSLYRNIIIQYVNAFLGIGYHAKGIKAIEPDNGDRGHKAPGRYDGGKPDLGFDVFNDHSFGNKKGRPNRAAFIKKLIEGQRY